MVSTFTPNVQIEEPARGDDVGTWDTPVNNNMTLIDLLVGGITTISGAAGSVVLGSAQFQSKTITVNSTLTASITLTFPTSFKKSYEIQNATTGSSQFIITLQTTAAGGQVIGVPPGTTSECFTDGTNVKFKNLALVGSYWDYAGSSVPAWVSGCTVPPWLLCDGSAVSSGTYPTLFGLLGATLPDARGRYRAALDAGTGRSTAASSVGASFGAATATLGTSNLPAYTPSGTVSITNGTNQAQSVGDLINAGGPSAAGVDAIVNITGSFTGAAQGGVSNPFSIAPPSLTGGITMIRAG